MSEASILFNHSIKDAEQLLERFDNENTSMSGHNAETLKRAGMVIAMAAWETYVKDRFHEEFNIWLKAVEGSSIGRFIKKKSEDDLKRFFNPNSDKVKNLFIAYFEVDVTQGWEWDNYDAPQARKALNTLISKRGDAAHRASTSNSEPHI